MYTNVYVCRANFSFLGRFFCVLPNSSSPSLKDTERTIWGHFAAFQLTAFTRKFSLDESSGFSVRAPRMSTKRPALSAHKGYLFDSGSLTRPSPKSMQLSWFGRSKSIQVDPGRSKWTGFLFFACFLDFADGSFSRFRQPNEAWSPLDAIILVWSTQVDPSRRKST